MSIKKINTIFIGTPDFGVLSLKELLKDKYFNVLAIITQPDKKIGRKQILSFSPIKTEAIKNNIPVYQPKNINKFDFSIINKNIDIMIVIAYAQIISEKILNLPKYGCINVHASLLPKYRGASCIQSAILNKDKKTGVTIMKIDKGLDTGPILSQNSININNQDTAGKLFEKLSKLGAKLLVETLKKYIDNKIIPQKQDNKKSSYVGLLKKEDGKIDFTKNAEYIERHIRAMSPWPGAFFEIKLKNKIKKIKIIKAKKIIKTKNNNKLFIHNNQLAMQCNQNALIIEKLQIEGKKEISAIEFINGYKNIL